MEVGPPAGQVLPDLLRDAVVHVPAVREGRLRVRDGLPRRVRGEEEVHERVAELARAGERLDRRAHRVEALEVSGQHPVDLVHLLGVQTNSARRRALARRLLVDVDHARDGAASAEAAHQGLVAPVGPRDLAQPRVDLRRHLVRRAEVGRRQLEPGAHGLRRARLVLPVSDGEAERGARVLARVEQVVQERDLPVGHGLVLRLQRLDE